MWSDKVLAKSILKFAAANETSREIQYFLGITAQNTPMAQNINY